MDQNIYSAMQTGKPIARFKKTVLGMVHTLVLNPFSQEPEGVILKGDPNQLGDESYVEIWNEMGLMFFKKMNKKHFEAGRLVEFTITPEETPSPNQISDEEIDEILGKPFLALDKKLNEFTNEAPAHRFLTRARELEKSEKIIKRIEETLAVLTQG